MNKTKHINKKNSRSFKASAVMLALAFAITSPTSTFTSNVFAIEKGKIVVTGTQSKRAIKDTAVRTEVISSDRIKEKNATDLYDILNNEPGIRVQEQCSNCNFSTLRMLGLENYSKVLIDGAPIFGGVSMVYGLQQIMAGDIEQVEIVKGPGAALYGSDAIAGVINVITKKPTTHGKYSLDAAYDTDGKYSLNIFTSKREGNLAYSFSGQRFIQQAIDENNDNYTDLVERNNTNINGKLSFFEAFGENSELSISMMAGNEFRKGGNFNTWDNPIHPDTEHIRTERNGIGINLEKEVDSGLVNWVTHYSNVHRNATNGAAWGDDVPDFSNPSATINLSAIPTPYLTDDTTVYSRLTYAFPLDSHYILAGIDYKNEWLNEVINGDPGVRNASDLGLIVQDEWGISDASELVYGVRYDIHQSKDTVAGTEYSQNALSPRIAYRHDMSDSLTLRASTGTSFRVPALFSEDFHLMPNLPTIKRPNDLTAENGLTTMAGLDYEKENYSFFLNIFNTQLTNTIVAIDSTDPNFDLEWSNEGGSFSRGIEAGGEWYYQKNASFDWAYTYTSAKLSSQRLSGQGDSTFISRTPDHTLSLTARYTDEPSDINFSLDADYLGQMYIDNDTDGDESTDPVVEKTTPYWLFNFQMSKDFSILNHHTWTLYGGVKNMFNYVQPKRNLDDPAYIYAPLVGRSFYAGVRMDL